jgi:hypothetical protein
MPEAKLEIRVEKDEAQRKVSEFSQAIRENMTASAASMELVSLASAKVQQALRAVADFVAEGIKEAAATEAAQRKLASALALRGRAEQSVLDRQLASNDVMRERFAIDDDELTNLQSRLVLLGVTASELDRATEATIGLSQATGGDLSSAGTAVAKAFAGHTEALKKLGVEGKDATEMLNSLAGMSAAAEAKAKGFEGAAWKLNDAITELKKALGEQVRDSVALRQQTDQTATAFRGAAEWVRDMGAALRGLEPPSPEVTRWLGPLLLGPVGPAATNTLKYFEKLGEAARDATEDATNAIDYTGHEIEQSRIDATKGQFEGLVEGVKKAEEAKKKADAAEEARKDKAAAAEQHRLRALREEREADERQRLAQEKQWADGQRARVEADKRAAEELAEVRRQAARERREDLDAERVGSLRQQEETGLAMREISKRVRAGASDLAEEFAVGTDMAYDDFAALRDSFRSVADEIATIGVQGGADMVSGLIAAVVAGREPLEQAAVEMFGGIVQMLGDTLIKEGTALIALGIVTGGATIPQGLALLAAGAALKAGGVGVSMSARPDEPTSSAASRTPAPRRAQGASTPNTAPAPTRSNVYNVYFDRGVIMGTPAQVGRAVNEATRRADRLRPGGGA